MSDKEKKPYTANYEKERDIYHEKMKKYKKSLKQLNLTKRKSPEVKYST